METELLKQARYHAFRWHEGQQYGRFPYCFHLMEVFKTLIENNYDDEELLAAAYLHDVVEDCGISINTISDLFGPGVSEYVWACTGVGKNRTERKFDMITKLTHKKKAVVLKMADRYVNIRNSSLYNDRLYKMYVNEMKDYDSLFKEANNDFFNKIADLCLRDSLIIA